MPKSFLLYIVCAALLFTNAAQVYAQSDSIQRIIERGMDLHTQGKYELSLVEYRKAHKIEPSNPLLNYEMALSYYYMGDKVKSEDHAAVAAKDMSESGVHAVILLGTLYDERGKPKKAIKLYEKAAKDFSDYYLIWFNLGVTANGMGDYELAASAFEKAVTNRLDHGNSHYALGTMMQIQGRRAEAMLPMYFFLLLEPDSDRSRNILATLNDLWTQGISMENDKNVTITLDIEDDVNVGLQSSDMMISMLEVAKSLKQNEGKSDHELYVEKLKGFFAYLGEVDLHPRKDFYTGYYIPFFVKIGQSEHLEAFVHFVLQSTDTASAEWVNTHPNELQDFFDWLDATEMGVIN